MTVPATGAGSATRRYGLSAFAYLLPALVVFGVFVFWPLVKSVILSVQGTDILGNPSGWVGLVNYGKLFSDPDFGKVLWVTLGFTVLTVVPSIAIALLAALLLQGRIRGIRFFRTAFALPFAFSVATASVIFGVLYNPASGVLNGLLSYIGVEKVHWLTDPDLALFSVSGATVWMEIGYNLLVLSAGLGALPDDVLEAARLDGAHGWRLQRSIVMPLITPQLFFLVVVGTIHSLQSFGQIKILTVGGPEGRTTTLVYSIYEQAFANNNSNYGYASAQAMVLLLVVLVITALQFGVLERKVFYR
jgi:sn-glycerol 3-phosphate transport system permease protein